MFVRVVAVSALASSLVACLPATEDDTGSTERKLDEPIAPTTLVPRGTYVPVPPHLDTPDSWDPAAGAPRYIYLNRNGGTYTPGQNDSSTNRSSIPSTTSSIPAWNVSSSSWNQLVSCVRNMFSRFNVVVTDQDPGATTHVEAVIAGYPQYLGLQSGVGGVSPFNCGMIEKSIVFAFAEVYGNNIQALCETAAQEIAHSYGLDHQYLCQDPMTYLGGCGSKSFQDANAQCGEYSPRSCQCGGSTQNSVQLLYQRLGAADQIAPTVSIDQPINGATVQAGFSVVVSASDDVGVTSVELYIDGQLAGTDSTAPYSFTTSSTLAAGSHMLEVRAYDGGNTSIDTINVTIEEPAVEDPPEDPPDIPEDPLPPDDPFQPGDLGAGCSDHAECLSGLCLSGFGENRCTDLCDPSAPDSCPDGFECLGTTGAESVCWPANPGGGSDPLDPPNITGGCSTSKPGAGALWWLALLVLLVRRRRFGESGPS